MPEFITTTPQTNASLDYLLDLADTKDHDTLLDRIDATDESRLGSLLVALIVRVSTQRTSPDQTDRQRRDLRSNLTRKMTVVADDFLTKAREERNENRLIEADAFQNKALGVRKAIVMVRESTHLA